MSAFYFDTSALVKRYSPENGSAWVSTLIASADNLVITSELTVVEVAATLAAKHRAPRGITQQERDEALALFLHHCITAYHLLATTQKIIDLAVVLSQNHRLRGYDALHLATALQANSVLLASGVPSLVFVSADNDQLTAAAVEGLLAENPTLLA